MSFTWLAGIDIMWAVVGLSGAYALLLLWVLTRRRAFIYEGAPDGARWRDLRLWIAPLVVLQVVLHWLLQ